MKRALLVIALLLAAAEARGESLRLRDGTLLFGEIVSHEETGVRLRRFDTGGMVDLRWEHLVPEEANRLREALGYLGHEAEGVRVLADRIRIADGTEMVGLLVDNRPDALVLRVRENTINIPKGRIVPPIDKVEVDALAVNTKDQLYNEKRAGLDATGAAGNVELARFCARIRDWRRVAEHYRKAKEIDPSHLPGEIAAGIRNAEERAAHEKEEETIDRIRALRARGDFAGSIALCEKFRADFPSSPLGKEVEDLRRRVIKDRDSAVRKEAVLGWYDLARRVASGKAAERSVTIEEAKAFAEKELAKEVEKLVLERAARLNKELDANAVRALFDGREVAKQRWQRASYGQGSFALGKEKARAGLEPQKESESKPAGDPQKRELEEKIRRYLKALQSPTGGAGATAEEEPQAWWDRASSGERGQWLLAYYAEFGGDMREVKAWADACRTCGGRGYLEELAPSTGGGNAGGGRGGGQGGGQQAGGVVRKTCPDCHGLQIYRTVTDR